MTSTPMAAEVSGGQVASAERLIRLLQDACLPAGRVKVDDVLPLLCAKPTHPVVAELIASWGVEGLIERLVICCRAVPSIERGELRAQRLARRLEYAVRDLNRDRRSHADSPGIALLAEPPTPVPSTQAVERFVTERIETLEAIVGRALPTSDRSVLEDLLHTSVDFAGTIACQLPPGDSVLNVLGQPTWKVPASRRLLPHLRQAWPEVPDPTLTATQRLVRFQLLDPAQKVGAVEPVLIRKWRSCYPALHRPIALRMASQQQERDYESSRWLRGRAVQGDWTLIEAALAESLSPQRFAA